MRITILSALFLLASLNLIGQETETFRSKPHCIAFVPPPHFEKTDGFNSSTLVKYVERDSGISFSINSNSIEISESNYCTHYNLNKAKNDDFLKKQIESQFQATLDYFKTECSYLRNIPCIKTQSSFTVSNMEMTLSMTTVQFSFFRCNHETSLTLSLPSEAFKNNTGYYLSFFNRVGFPIKGLD